MKNPFKSKYYFRIIDRIADKENEKADLISAKVSANLGSEWYRELNSLVVKVQKDIDLLRNLL